MGYHTLRQCVDDLERHGNLVRIEQEVDAHLEVAEIHRRVCEAGGPAICYAQVKGCHFPMVSNLFGTIEHYSEQQRTPGILEEMLVEEGLDTL